MAVSLIIWANTPIKRQFPFLSSKNQSRFNGPRDSQSNKYASTTGHHGKRHSARVKTYGEILCEYEFHPESKCADSSGNPCGKQTIGLLQRRLVRIDLVKYIGKESNSLEDVESGLVHTAQTVYTEYSDPRRDEWQAKTLRALKKVPLKILVKKSGMSRRALMDARAGRSRPHRKNRERLVSILKKFGLI